MKDNCHLPLQLVWYQWYIYAGESIYNSWCFIWLVVPMEHNQKKTQARKFWKHSQSLIFLYFPLYILYFVHQPSHMFLLMWYLLPLYFLKSVLQVIPPRLYQNNIFVQGLDLLSKNTTRKFSYGVNLKHSDHYSRYFFCRVLNCQRSQV